MLTRLWSALPSFGNWIDVYGVLDIGIEHVKRHVLARRTGYVLVIFDAGFFKGAVIEVTVYQNKCIRGGRFNIVNYFTHLLCS